MSHRNARLTLHGRRELVRRVRNDHRPVAHVAAEMGVSRQCAHKWVRRFDVEGEAGLQDRPSRPHRMPGRTPAAVEQRVLKARREHRCDAVGLAFHTGVPASTCGRIMRRHRVPWLSDCDPITGALIRARRTSAQRYEHPRPGDLLHVDVKKIGRIPDGGGWRVHGRREDVRGRGIGYDYVHTAVDDHSRVAYAEILPDEKGTTTAGFLARAIAWFTAHGVAINAILTDNAMNYRLSRAVADLLADHGIKHRRTRPHCPWTNGKAERFNRTLAKEWAYRRAYRTNHQRSRALPRWLNIYNNQRPHTALGGQPPITRLSPTS